MKIFLTKSTIRMPIALPLRETIARQRSNFYFYRYELMLYCLLVKALIDVYLLEKSTRKNS